MKTDRREIKRFLLPHFPEMADLIGNDGRKIEKTSDEWHAFLNQITGLDVPIDQPNGSAFDAWRQALAEKHGYPVWPITPTKVAEFTARGAELAALTKLSFADQAERTAAEIARIKKEWSNAEKT